MPCMEVEKSIPCRVVKFLHWKIYFNNKFIITVYLTIDDTMVCRCQNCIRKALFMLRPDAGLRVWMVGDLCIPSHN